MQECLHHVLISCVLHLFYISGAAFEPSGDTVWRRPLVTVWNCVLRGMRSTWCKELWLYQLSVLNDAWL